MYNHLQLAFRALTALIFYYIPQYDLLKPYIIP